MIVYDGESALSSFETFQPNLILLDLMLPGIDGYQVCREIRTTSSVPIIMLSAKSEDNDKILGLNIGADDYMTKPFDPKELIARINAVLRRTEIPEDTKKRLVFDKLIIDLDSYELIVDGKKIDTPPKELELLPLGAKIITLELAVRFLTDYLDGDRYFRVAYPEHNLVRARAQMKLVADMEAHWDEMQAIVAEEAAKRN